MLLDLIISKIGIIEARDINSKRLPIKMLKINKKKLNKNFLFKKKKI